MALAVLRRSSAEVRNERSHTPTPPLRVHGMLQADLLTPLYFHTFFVLLSFLLLVLPIELFPITFSE